MVAQLKHIAVLLSVLCLFSKRTAASSSWVTVNTTGLPTKRHEACFVMVGDKGYLLGGRGVRPVDMYDPSSQTWTAKTGPGTELHHMQCVAHDDKVWIVSAWTGNYPYETNVAEIWIYDTVTDTWSTKEGLPEERRRGGAAAVLYNDKIYVSHGNRGGHGPHSDALGWLDKYNITNDVWITNLADAPNPRDHTGGAIVNGELCVAAGRDSGIDNNDNGGGVDGGGGVVGDGGAEFGGFNPERSRNLRASRATSFFNAVVLETDCYNFTTGQWTVRASIPTGRAGSAYATTCDGNMMVAGGEGFGQAFPNVDIFNGTSWTPTADLVNGRHGTGLAVSCECDQIHIASGSITQGGGGESTLTETYFPSGINTPCVASTRTDAILNPLDQLTMLLGVP